MSASFRFFAVEVLVLVTLVVPLSLRAQEPPGQGMLERYFEEEVARVRDACLTEIDTLAAWKEARGNLRRELKRMLGLDPEPPREDLRATVTGTVVREDLGFAVDKLHYQSVPGLYVTANLYRPLAVDGRLPAVLYLCGHGRVKKDGISYGNKAHYQHHPGWFARNGYVCLVIDTLQLGEIEGVHHGTYRLDMWWWVSRGYTPAGVEAWNSIRAVDYLVGRDDVDAERIAVTGRSGGGIGTWWLAALDDRPSVFVPVAGITDMQNHIITGCIEGHCDCNYLINLYRWDYPALAALAAPRPLLLANTDKDRIFPLDGVYRLHRKLERIYALHDKTDQLGLCIIEGPHSDTQELRIPAFQWIDRWLRGRKDREPIETVARPFFEPEELKVFDELPADQENTTIQESFVKTASPPEVPDGREAFGSWRAEVLERLRATTFRNLGPLEGPLRLEQKVAVERADLRLEGYEFSSDDAFRLPLWIVRGAQAKEPSLVVLNVLSDEDWDAWIREVAIPFAAELGVDAGAGDPGRTAQLHRMLTRQDWAFAILPPRGVGPTRWGSDPRKLNHIRRRFYALGRTLAQTRVFDVRRAVRALGEVDAVKDVRLWIQARGEMAGVALYAGIFEPRVERFELWTPPVSHREGVALLKVLDILDMPQAAALPLPRKVHIYNVPADRFDWTARAARLFETDEISPFLLRQVPARPPADGGERQF